MIFLSNQINKMKNKLLKMALFSSFGIFPMVLQAQQNPATRTIFFDKSGMDPSVKPGDNFFKYANGGWIKSTKIPDDQSSWGSFVTLYDGNQKNLKSILDEVSIKKKRTRKP